MRNAKLLLVLSCIVAGGCRQDEPRLADTPPDTTPPLGQMAPSAPAAGVEADRLRAEADALDRHVMELRTHIGTMRQISPAMAGTVMEQHAAHVRVLSERIRDQRAGLPVQDGALPTLLGMSEEEYGVMVEEVQRAMQEVEAFAGGDESTVRDQLPGHLDRLERIAGQLEQGAASLRR